MPGACDGGVGPHAVSVLHQRRSPHRRRSPHAHLRIRLPGRTTPSCGRRDHSPAAHLRPPDSGEGERLITSLLARVFGPVTSIWLAGWQGPCQGRCGPGVAARACRVGATLTWQRRYSWCGSGTQREGVAAMRRPQGCSNCAPASCTDRRSAGARRGLRRGGRTLARAPPRPASIRPPGEPGCRTVGDDHDRRDRARARGHGRPVRRLAEQREHADQRPGASGSWRGRTCTRRRDRKGTCWRARFPRAGPAVPVASC